VQCLSAVTSCANAGKAFANAKIRAVVGAHLKKVITVACFIQWPRQMALGCLLFDTKSDGRRKRCGVPSRSMMAACFFWRDYPVPLRHTTLGSESKDASDPSDNASYSLVEDGNRSYLG
jgi:hypothetical protein